MSKKQATLFQSWGNKAKVTEDRPQPVPQPSTSAAHNEVIDLCGSFEDEDDDLLCEAEESVANISRTVGQPFSAHPTSPNQGSRQYAHGSEKSEIHIGDISIGADGFAPTQVQTQSTNFPGFDKCAGKLWIYPTNYSVREYQFNIVQQALFKNTMVTLPTGLGKTFIGAVVMYNFYRWYPQGKVIFMAPTKPLVAQQIEACYNIMGIPQDHTAEMTGSMGPPKRERAWHDKRVFFLTPQVLTNDLSRGSCPAHDVKCLVIDEAHKALGNHAYCQVVRELVKYTENFRILSLSATPGSDIKAVQQVLNNLLISQIEIRTEESIDIKRYSHERKVEKVVVPLGDELTKVKTKYVHIMEVVVNRLKRHGVLYNKDTTSLSKFLILKSRESFRQNPPERLQRNQYGMVEGDFALAMSLYHGYELLQLHGSRSLYNFLDGILTGEKGYGRTRTELTKNADFNELMGLLSGKYTKPDGETPSQAQRKPFVIGHPKMEKLQKIVLDHFNTHSDATTRVMIFSQYRDSVQEITDMLHVHQPVIKVMSFIGQATAGKSTKGFTQKEQLKVMKQFREGGYNTLVSTCVGEEGLDIGDVDLIICFDAHKSPIRLVQRMGRTGRKREGRIVMLVTQGKEEQIYNQSQYSKKSIHKAILNGAKSLHFYQHSPRMLPDSFTPTCHKMHITVKENFRPTRKITTDKDVNQSKITSMMSDAASKKDQSEEIITLEEFRELEPWLVPEEDIPKLLPCKITCLEKEKGSENQAVEGKYLSLSEWSPWQNTLQDTIHVDHSLGSKHLVQLMEFVQLQQSLDSDDDPYGLEMAAYLNKEDILKPGEVDAPSILRFCESKQNKSNASIVKKGRKKGENSKSRRSDNLPNFDFLDDKAIDSSDEDLPVFNVDIETEKVENDKTAQMSKEKSKFDGKGEETLSKKDATDIADGRKDFHEEMDISDEEINSQSESNEKTGECLKKSESTLVRKPFISRAKSLEKRMNVTKIRKKKKSRHNSGQTSIIKLIADSDSNDFDGAPDVSVIDNEKIQDFGDISDYFKEHKAASLQTEKYQSVTDCSDNELDAINIAGKDLTSGSFRIQSPPPIEDVEKLCEALERDSDFGSIDLFTAIDEWHMENKDGKYIVYPENMMDELSLDGFDGTKHTQKKMSIPTVDEKVTGILSHEKRERNNERTKSNRIESDTSIELSKEKSPNYLFVGSNSDPANSRSSKVDLEIKISLDSSHGSTKKRKKLFTSPPDQNLEENEIHQQYRIDKIENVLIHDNTKLTEHNEDDDIACTGNFMLNADDVLLSNDRWSDEEMNEIQHSFYSKKESPTISVTSENWKITLDEEIDLCNNKPENIEKKNKCRQVSFHDSDNNVSSELNEVHKKVESEEKLSIVNLGSKESLNSSNESASNEKLPVPFSTYDSFLGNDKDDDIFMDMKTPVGSKLHETSTQITFTQALNFVHSGSRLSGSESCSESRVKEFDKLLHDENRTGEIPSPRFCLKNTIHTIGDDDGLGDKGKEYMKEGPDQFGMSDSSNEFKNLENEQFPTATEVSRKDSTSSGDGVEMPEFDLGFDFDEDIIPPSPNASQASQKPSNRLSQTFAFTHHLGPSRSVVDEVASDNKNIPSGESTDVAKSDQQTNSGSALNKVLKSKKNLNLQDQQKAAFVKPFKGNELEEESQSVLGDNLMAPVRHRTSNAMNVLGKANLETISENAENEFIDAEIVTKKDRSGDLNAVDKGVKQGNNETNEFDTSFALLGEDLDDWIDSGVEPVVKEKQKHEVDSQIESKKEDKENSVNEQDHDSSPSSQKSILAPQFRNDTPVAIVNPVSFSLESIDRQSNCKNQSKTSQVRVTKNIRKSIFSMEDLSSDFDDSFTFTSDMMQDKTTPKKSGSALLQRHNTSTPMFSMNKNVQSVSPCIETGSTPIMITNQKTVKGMDATPIRTTSNTPFRVTDNTPVSSTSQGNNQTFQDSPWVEPLTENDDSFIVRRKKKVQILDSPLSQRVGTNRSVTELVECHSYTNNENETDNNLKTDVRKKKTVFLLSSDSDHDDFDDSVMLTKNKYIVKQKDPPMIDHSSDEDFENSAILLKQQIPWKSAKKNLEISVEKRENSKVTNKVKLKRGTIRKRTSNPFIEEEAELSDEEDSAASSDEHEGSDLDTYEGSFIADSQFTESQALDQTDVQALYLKSVKSPLAHRGGYKLQFNHRNDIDVFSQRPPPEESHYMEDSFCVGSEEEEDAWLMGEDPCDSDDEPKEITLMQNSLMQTGRKRRKGLQAFQTSRQREIQVGRMKALSEIRSKLAGKTANSAQQKRMNDQSSIKAGTGKLNSGKRSRIQIQEDSSSDEDGNKFHLNRSDLMSPKVQPRNTNKRPRQVLSSDDSESEEFNESRSNTNRGNINIQSSGRNETDTWENIKTIVSSASDKQTADELRQERLKKQREKQSEFRRLMEDKQKTDNVNLTNVNAVNNQSGLTKIKEKSGVISTTQGDRFEFTKPSREYEDGDTYLLTTSSVNKSKFSEKSVILVDSKEISGSQDIISDLRFKHDVIVSAASLPGCDYIISNRMAVERKQWSEFSNGTNRTKLIERMQHLGELYDRPCLIVEKDRVKPGEEKSTRPVHWTKYIDRTLALLQRSETKVMFTDNYTETAEVLADLCRLEQRKNMGINVPVELNGEQLNRVKFFVSIPKLSYIHALNLCEGFKSVSEFLKSSVVLLESLGKMSRNRAIEVYNYVRRQFDANMLPSSYK